MTTVWVGNVGHRPLTRRSLLVAALLAVGPDAALSHRTAAEVWGIRNPSWKIEVTSPRSLGQRDGVVIHRSPLPSDEVELKDDLLVTTPARTILDLAAVLPAQQVRRAVEQVEILHLGSRTGIGELLARYRTRKGTRFLRKLVGEQAPARQTKR